MLDIKFIQANKDQVELAITNKGIDLDINQLIKIYEQKTKLVRMIDELRSKRKDLSKEFAHNSASEDIKKASQELKANLNKLENDHHKLTEQFDKLMLLVPNIPWPDAPVGKDDSANKTIKKVGQPPKFTFTPKSHIELGEELDLIDLVKGTKTSGFHGYYLKNEAVLLHYGLLQLGLAAMVKSGFTLMIPPAIVKDFTLYGSGHFPFGKKEIFELTNPDSPETNKNKYLAGTSEPSLLAYYAGQTIDESELPIKLCGVGSCYREEIGSYGKYNKGLYRVREFMKVEQVIICRPDQAEADKWFEVMLNISEKLLQDLELSYQLVETSTGDMGAGKRRMVDIETWMPSRDGYGETHSNSDLTDWQARRLNIKVMQDKKHAFTLNNTVVASPRILISILEANQNEDGSVNIPKLLQKFVGKKKITAKK